MPISCSTAKGAVEEQELAAKLGDAWQHVFWVGGSGTVNVLLFEKIWIGCTRLFDWLHEVLKPYGVQA